jgi:hypothetical protein
MRLAVSAFAVASLCAVPALAQSDRSINTETQVEMPDTPMLGAHLARGVRAQQVREAGSSPNLIWHSGAILNSTKVVAIYWGSSWTPSNPKIAGLASFYGGLGGSSYMNTNTEYTGTNGQVGSGVTYQTGYVDTASAPRNAPRTSAVLSEVCKVLSTQGVAPVSNSFYPVYVDTKRGHAGYCAWHSYGTCNGVPIQFGFFFNLDGDPGCDPGDTQTGHAQGLAALGNVSGHEISETATDPRNGGWWDSSGAENADKCAWTFGAPFVTLKNGSIWKVQGNWSNAAYNTSSGYDGAGCIQTK